MENNTEEKVTVEDTAIIQEPVETVEIDETVDKQTEDIIEDVQNDEPIDAVPNKENTTALTEAEYEVISEAPEKPRERELDADLDGYKWINGSLILFIKIEYFKDFIDSAADLISDKYPLDLLMTSPGIIQVVNFNQYLSKTMSVEDIEASFPKMKRLD